MKAATKMITVRLPETMFRAAHVAAIRKGRSLNQWCVARLEEGILSQGLDPASAVPTIQRSKLPARREGIQLTWYCSICRKPTPRMLFLRLKWRCFKCDRRIGKRHLSGSK